MVTQRQARQQPWLSSRENTKDSNEDRGCARCSLALKDPSMARGSSMDVLPVSVGSGPGTIRVAPLMGHIAQPIALGVRLPVFKNL